MPRSARTSGPGADSPKRSMATIRPPSPTHSVPPERAGGLHGHAGPEAGRQDRVAVGRGLRREELEGGHADHPRADAVGGQQPAGAQGDGHLRAGADQDAVVAVGQHVGPPLDLVGAVEDRQPLAGEDQHRGRVAALQGDAPRRGGLVGVGRPQGDQVRHGAQRGQVLDRLVGGAVLSQRDRIVGVDEDRPQAAQRGQPHRVLHVVVELEEGGAGRAQAAVRVQAVGDGAHGVLAHAEAEVALAVVPALDVARALDRRVGGAGEVRRALDQLGHGLGQGVDDPAARGPGRDRAVVGREAREGVPPARRQLAGQHPAQLRGLGRIRRGVGLHRLVPLGDEGLAPRAHLGRARRPPRAARGSARPRAIRRPSWSPAPPPRPGPSRARRRCPACAASRSRCACGSRSGSAARRGPGPARRRGRGRRGRCRRPRAAPASRRPRTAWGRSRRSSGWSARRG